MNSTLDYVLSKSAQRIALLHPVVATKAEQLIRQTYSEGISILIVQGLRTMAEQQALYDQGRTKPGDIVTNAKAGQSYHNYGLAIDYALFAPNGIDVLWTVNDQWRRVAAIGKSLGFAWGGDWTGFVDYPHLEMTFGLSINDLQAGKVPNAAENGGSKLMDYNQVIKERIHASGGKLVYSPVTDRKVKATDVRILKIKKGAAHFQFVYRKGAKASDLVKEYGADFGFNGPYFWDGQVLGDSEDKDVVISSAYGKMLKWHEFAAVDGAAKIGQLNKNERQDFLIQGAPLLIENGNPCWDYYRIQQEVPDDIGKSSAQRTFVGVDSVGDLLIGIADGRASTDKGLTLEEMSLYMQDKGAVNALNLDGGSSTILANQAGGINQAENTGVNERAVNHAILVFLNLPETPAPVKDWKREIHDKARAVGIISEDWSSRLDDPAPVWMVLSAVLNSKE